MAEVAKFLLIGRLLTWFLQTNGLLRPIWESAPKLQELAECDLCLGFWVYLLMATLDKRKDEKNNYPWLFGCIIQAAVFALAAHLLRLGWHSKFGVTVI